MRAYQLILCQNAYISKRHPTRQEGILEHAPSLVNPVWTRHSFYHTWFVHVLHGTLTQGRTLIFEEGFHLQSSFTANWKASYENLKVFSEEFWVHAQVSQSTRSFIHGNLEHPLGLTEHLLIWQPVNQRTVQFWATFKLECANTMKPISATLVHLFPTPPSLSNMLIILLRLYLLPVLADETFLFLGFCKLLLW